MKLDKALYRKAFALHRQYNDAEIVDRAYHAGKLSPQEGWRQYVALWELCMRLAPSIDCFS
jgi:hypothetical protein